MLFALPPWHQTLRGIPPLRKLANHPLPGLSSSINLSHLFKRFYGHSYTPDHTFHNAALHERTVLIYYTSKPYLRRPAPEQPREPRSLLSVSLSRTMPPVRQPYISGEFIFWRYNWMASPKDMVELVLLAQG